MSEIQKLLYADADNVKNCEWLFQNYSPELSQAIEDCAQFYKIIRRVAEKNFRDDADQYNIEAADDPENFLKEELARNRIWSRRARATLLLSGYRSYMWAATDIYRTRLTSSMNHLRQQIEAVFYMNLILSKPSVGEEWFNIGPEEGKKFFRKYSSELGTFLDKFKLANTYNRISAAASHTRLSSVIYGLEIKSKTKDDRYIDVYSLKMQEIDPDKPERFILNVLDFLANQIKIFDSLLSALPEFDDPLLSETRFPLFKNKVSHLFALFKKKFPFMIPEIQKEDISPNVSIDS